MKKDIIMVIGAGFGQVPAIIKGRHLGYDVIAVDKNPNALGKKYANKLLAIDVIDISKIVAAAKEYEISGVVTMQTDLPVPSIGAVNDSLGLSGISFEVANICSNKCLTREFFAKAKIPQPVFCTVDNINDAKRAACQIGFPCVLKAPDSSGSRGVMRVDSECGVEYAVQEALKYSRVKKVIVEEYIDGLEFGVQSFCVGGKCVKVLIHNDTLSPAPYMVPVGHSFPFKMNGAKVSLIEEVCAKAVETIGILDGPANLDLIFTENGGPKIIEIGARIGATCLPELVKYYSGIDWVASTILNSVGASVDFLSKRTAPVAALILESSKEGVFQSWSVPDSVLRDANFLEAEVSVKMGEAVSALRKGTDRIGKVIAKGADVIEAEMKVELFKSLIEVDVQ